MLTCLPLICVTHSCCIFQMIFENTPFKAFLIWSNFSMPETSVCLKKLPRSSHIHIRYVLFVLISSNRQRLCYVNWYSAIESNNDFRGVVLQQSRNVEWGGGGGLVVSYCSMIYLDGSISLHQ